MMTNGPSAHIGEDLEIPFSRPRNRARIMEDPHYYELRNFALDFLFRRFAHSEVEEEASTAPSSSTSSPVPQSEAQEKIEKTAAISSTTSPAKSAATATKSAATMPFNAVKATKESNMSSEPISSDASKSLEPSRGKGIALGAAWLATIIGLTAVSVGSVSNLQKESAQAEANAVSTSSTLNSSPSRSEPVAIAPPAPASAMNAAPTTAIAPPAPASAMNAAPTTAIAPPAPTANSTSKTGITDKAEIDALKQKLYSQIDTTWKTTPTFTEDLVYRVKVKQDGSILQYEATNKSAKDYVQETPLASVQSPASPTASDAQKTAEFRVTFSPSNGGTFEVKPWQ